MSRNPPLPPIKPRTGIVGIERGIQEKQRATNETISEAFQDLKVLMGKAQEMVAISRNISAKIKEKQGDISEDETVQFKSYLLSLGIDDPVTKDNFSSSSKFYKSLAQEITTLLEGAVQEMGGLMTLPVAFCRVNRARGLDLISPDDLLHAAQIMESLQLPLKLRRLASGVLVLQLAYMDDDTIGKDTADIVKKNGSLAALDLANKLEVPISVAQERLQIAEKLGLLARDDSSSGVQYFWNLFLHPDEDLIIPYLY